MTEAKRISALPDGAPIGLAQNRNLIELVARQFGDRPAAIALRFEDRATSYAELDKLSNRCAHALIAAGMRPGVRVAALTRNSDLFVILLLGAIKAGVCLTPINARLAEPEILYILRDCGARLLVYSDEHDSQREALAQEIGVTAPLIRFEAPADGAPGFMDWLSAHDDSPPALAMAGRDAVIQLYTSGTTGRPKGVPLSHSNYLAFIPASIEAGWANWEAGQAVLLASPLFHVAGINVALIALAQGACSFIVREVNVRQLIALIPDQRIAYAFLAPTMINMLLQAPEAAKADFSSLRKVCYGASAITDALLQAAIARFGCDFTQLYGMTETTGGGVQLSPEAHFGSRLRSCGKPIRGYEVRIGAENGQPVAAGEVGEIEIRGAGVMHGYWRLPEANSAAFSSDRWFRTGDAGYLDDEGFVYIHDRVKDMIISGGENIYPAEVENAIYGHPAVADVAVIAVPDEKWGEAVKAVVVPVAGRELDAASIIAWARTRIAGYKLPKSVEFVDVLPRNAAGKVLRRELRERFWTGHSRRVG